MSDRDFQCKVQSDAVRSWFNIGWPNGADLDGQKARMMKAKMNRPGMLFTMLMLVCHVWPCMTVSEIRAADSEVAIDFERDIRPIFEDNCSACHGEDEQESGFRLDSRVGLLRGGDYGQPAIVPGDVAKSYLIDVVSHSEPGMEMPPDEDKLPEQQIELLKRWIEQGAVWPGQMDQVVEEEVDHWAFLPRRTEFEHDNIDVFLEAKLAASGLEFSTPADPRSLIRRVSIVLTGLAPTPERTQEFITAFEADSQSAYEQLVDELLDSPHFGERWAQHWLDVIRWAETNGSESNLYRKNAWMYRDYVVRAFNEDKPYDEFVREQLAGDVMGQGDATGFLVAGPHVPAATVGQEATAIRQARADRMDEIIQTVGASVMGVTIGCARCHNHKFDPISIQDYYSLAAAFQDVEFGGRYPELKSDHPRMLRNAELRAELSELRAQMLQNGWAWVEDWTGFSEVHFPAKTVNEMRLSFSNRWLQIDELEVIEADGDGGRNVAHQSFGTVVTDNPVTHLDGKSPMRLIDSEFGTQSWRASSQKGVEETPWLHFQFPETVTIHHLRLSSNREDFFETDYLEGLNKNQYGDFKIEFRDEDGNWKAFAATAAMKARDKENEKRQALRGQIDALIAQLSIEGPQPAFLARFVEPAPTHVLSRGSPESPRDEVVAAAPKRLGGKLGGGDLGVGKDSPGPERRQALAQWLVDPENPLTARVMANRIWHHLFGHGIVATPSDFGKAGAAPTHPQLLDWMAGEFVNSDWSIKQLIRKIVMTRAFRQSSRPREQALQIDAAALLLWRFPPRRVEAEVLRDSMLQASARLDGSIGGPSYRIHNVKKRYAQWEVVDNHSEPTWRRMLYQERMRRVDDRIFTAFDFPDCGQIRAQRPVSTTPLQALNLMNSDFVVTQSELIAQRAQGVGDDPKQQAIRCFELILCRAPGSDELDAALNLIENHDLPLLCRTLINTNEFAFLP